MICRLLKAFQTRTNAFFYLQTLEANNLLPATLPLVRNKRDYVLLHNNILLRNPDVPLPGIALAQLGTSYFMTEANFIRSINGR